MTDLIVIRKELSRCNYKELLQISFKQYKFNYISETTKWLI